MAVAAGEGLGAAAKAHRQDHRPAGTADPPRGSLADAWAKRYRRPADRRDPSRVLSVLSGGHATTSSSRAVGSRPRGRPPVPAFTLALLPHSLASWVVDVADRVQCPPAFAAVGIIVAEAAVIGRQIATAFEERDPFLMELTVWPGYDSLRRSARFRGLTRKLQLPG